MTPGGTVTRPGQGGCAALTVCGQEATMITGIAHLVLSTTLSGAAAEMPAPAPATRLRVTIATSVAGLPGLRPGRKLAGRLVSESADALVIKFDDSKAVATVPRSAVRRIEVSAGRAPRGPYILGGAVIGVMIGTAVASGMAGGDRTAPPAPRSNCGMPLCNFDEWLGYQLRDFSVGADGLAGAIVGAMLGGSIGSAAAPERWRPRGDVRVGVSVTPVKRGAAVGLSLRF
jgi:hypothetical protein